MPTLPSPSALVLHKTKDQIDWTINYFLFLYTTTSNKQTTTMGRGGYNAPSGKTDETPKTSSNWITRYKTTPTTSKGKRRAPAMWSTWQHQIEFNLKWECHRTQNRSTWYSDKSVYPFWEATATVSAAWKHQGAKGATVNSLSRGQWEQLHSIMTYSSLRSIDSLAFTYTGDLREASIKAGTTAKSDSKRANVSIEGNRKGNKRKSWAAVIDIQRWAIECIYGICLIDPNVVSKIRNTLISCKSPSSYNRGRPQSKRKGNKSTDWLQDSPGRKKRTYRICASIKSVLWSRHRQRKESSMQMEHRADEIRWRSLSIMTLRSWSISRRGRKK